MIFPISLLSLLVTCVRADLNPAPFLTHVRTRDVLAHLSAQSIPIDWHFFAANLANNTEAADYVIVQDINGDSVACYGSGSWARDYVLAGLVGSACATFAFGLNVGKYIIADLNQAPADSNRYQGSTQILKYTGLYNEANDPMNVFYKYTPSATGFTGSVACAGTLTHLINDLCQGKNDDTRGGEIKTKNEKFSVDPTTLNCNC